MACGCKKGKAKRGSGRAKFLSGVTWQGYGKKGSGMRISGGGWRKRRGKTKRAGMSFSGSGMRISGGAMRVVRNKGRFL